MDTDLTQLPVAIVESNGADADAAITQEDIRYDRVFREISEKMAAATMGSVICARQTSERSTY